MFVPAGTIVETSSNQFFRVQDAGPGLEHAWLGVAVFRSRVGFIDRKRARPVLVRKLGCRVICAPEGWVEIYVAARMTHCVGGA